MALLIAACLGAWWSDRRLQVLEDRLTEVERLGPKVDGFRQEVEKDLSRVKEIQEGIAALEKGVAPLAKLDKSMDALTEQMGKDVAPEVAKISDIVTGLASTSSQLKAVAEAVATTRTQIADKLDKQGTETAAELANEAKGLAAVAKELQGLTEAQTGVLVEVAKLQTQMQAIADAQGSLAGTADEVKMLTAHLEDLEKAVESLGKQMEDMRKKLSDTKRSGPT